MGIVENETSELHWECFRMARFAGLPHAEIGQRLGLTSTNVSTIANRIYDSIRREAEHQRRLIDHERSNAPQI
jgi:DNA-directed RNA polymerase specialized sigma24 family protein